jgi:hypothetical protein
MKHHTTRLNTQGQEQTSSHQQNVERQSAMEFATAEEMLRHDASQTAVPPAVADRLQRSVECEPKPVRGWWQRLFGGT